MTVPLLSICVPTNNGESRLPFLFESVRRYWKSVDNPSDIELVISDNASADKTNEVVESFSEEFPGLVKTHYHSVDIEERNFEFVLKLASGKYRKLIGDTFYFIDNSLAALVNLVRQVESTRPNLFLLNGNKGKNGLVVLRNDTEFIHQVSFWSTWIGFFGIWDHELHCFPKFEDWEHSHFPHTHAVFCLTLRKHSITINQRMILEIDRTGNAHNMNIQQIVTRFGGQYLSIVRELAHARRICLAEYEAERINVLSEYVLKRLYLQKLEFDGRNFELFYPYWSKKEIIIALDRFTDRILARSSS